MAKQSLATKKTAKRPTTTSGANSPGGSNTSNRVTSGRSASFTVPGLSLDEGRRVAAVLQERLVASIDLALTLKHIHWNVVGPNFISVHQMLDPQHDGVQAMVDELAERISTLGGVPSGLPGRVVETRTWADYSLERADALAHLGALDLVYEGLLEDHCHAIETVSDIDPMSEDLLIGQTRQLQQYHWFVRAHLADWAGGMANAGADSEMAAAQAVAAKDGRKRTSAGRAGRDRLDTVAAGSNGSGSNGSSVNGSGSNGSGSNGMKATRR